MPAGKPPILRFERAAPDAEVMDGLAVRKIVCVVYGTESLVTNFTFSAFVPKADRPVPAFIHLGNFGRHRNFNPDRTVRTGYWPAEEIVRRGYAAIGYFANDVIDPFGSSADRARPGELAIWAWGASRIVDWIEKEPMLDASHVAIVGHSRGGKAAIVAGVADTRFVLVCSNDSGCGGAKLNALELEGTETPAKLVRAMPGWFTPSYVEKVWAGEPVGFDQHQVLALLAPRLLAVGSATEDVHAGPQSEHLAAVLASPAWEAYGRKGLVTAGFPRVATPEQEGSVSYHLRRGIHTLTPYDWNRYLDFADRHGWRGR